MSTEIYYFSGTGNSLHVAKELLKRLPETTLIPMVSLVDKEVIEPRGDTVGFVFPIHMMTLPGFLKNIIKKFDLKSTAYIFAVATKWGTPCGTAFSKIENILKKKGKRLDSYLIVNMASNDPKFKDWHQATKEDIAGFESKLQDKLNSFQKIITDKVKYREEDTYIPYPVNFLMEQMGSFFAGISSYTKESFYADANCSGCGTCEKVCLSQRIKMIDKKPVWQKDSKCFFCYACLNYCPVRAVQIKSSPLLKTYTATQGRYHHPEATAKRYSRAKMI